MRKMDYFRFIDHPLCCQCLIKFFVAINVQLKICITETLISVIVILSFVKKHLKILRLSFH